MDLNQNDVVGGHYQIESELGRGGFGITYLAKNRHKIQPEDLVALKQVSIAQQNNNIGERSSSYLANLEREARVLATLKHDCIPEFLGRFEENSYFYIVQEYIEGNDLRKEIVPGKKLAQPEAIAMLRDILTVLQIVHDKNIIHRDIKPANLIRRNRDQKIVLIDFGAVKEIMTKHTNSSGITVTRIIGAPAYMPPEQAIGNPQLNSDIYALGVTMLQAVTGFSSEEIYDIECEPHKDNYGNYVWEDYATEIDDGLKKIISKMIQYRCGDRYLSVAEVLEALDSTTGRLLPLPPLTTIVRIALVLAILTITAYYQRINLLSLFNPACTLETGDHLSCGEETLYAASKSYERAKANQAVRENKYELALEYYQSSWQKDGRDAETLIYMNNALLEANNIDYYTLVVAVPLSYKQGIEAKNYELGQDLLRGVAQAQTEINLSLTKSDQATQYNLPGKNFLEPRSISPQKSKGLKIVILDDRNSEDESKKMAPIITAKPKVLGLIGHYASNVTLGAINTYEKQQLPQVSPTTSTSELSEHHRSSFFRVVYTTIEDAQATSSTLESLAIKDKKIAIFYNPSSDYSNNLRSKLKEIIRNPIVKEFNIAEDQNFSTSLALKEAKSKGANIFILLPDGQETNALAKAIELIQADNGNTVILGGNPLVNSKIEQIKTDRPLQLIATTYWHFLLDPEETFAKNSQKLWRAKINGKTSMAYDATLALIEAIKLQKNPTRQNVLKQLSTPGFTFDGATGQDIKFNTPQNGDRLNFSPTLVRLVNCGNSNSFVPLSIDDLEASNLACQPEKSTS
ncbi:MAG: hypothetical protein RLZZ04_4537 [Cyanobacteriota bacterium]|jgi:ABC-type branched-subunit amino acid transport system substrate-binding protein